MTDFSSYLDPKRALLAILTGAALVLGAGPASAQLKAPGEVRWFVDSTTNVIVNSTSFASVPIPAGHTAVLKSVVDAACSCASRGRGLWDGTTYTLPPSEQALTTDAGRLKAAARRLYQRLIGLSEGLAGVASYWPREDVSLGHDLMAYAHRGVRGVVMSPSWTVAQKLTFMKQMALGPSDVTNPAEYFEVIEMDEDIPPPSTRTDKRVIWVNPDTGLRVALADWTAHAVDTDQSNDGVTVLSRMAAETVDLTDYIGGAWIDSIVQ